MAEPRNLRDVGVWVNLIAGKPLLAEGRLLRSGKLDEVSDLAEIGSPKAIVNLRMGPDRSTFGIPHHHLAISNDVEKYETSNRAVRRWINDVVTVIASSNEAPILVHCTSGKDRTGVIVAAVLTVVGIPREVIVDEYLLSNGEVRRVWIEQAIDGIGSTRNYLDHVDVGALKQRMLRGEHALAHRLPHP